MRSPATDPKQGDSLSFQGYRITVQDRAGNSIRYLVTKKGQAPRQSTQDLQEWSKWAAGAKVSQRAAADGECCVLTFGIVGRCMGCKARVETDVHVGDKGIFCATCCVALRHGKPKSKGAKAA